MAIDPNQLVPMTPMRAMRAPGETGIIGGAIGGAAPTSELETATTGEVTPPTPEYSTGGIDPLPSGARAETVQPQSIAPITGRVIEGPTGETPEEATGIRGAMLRAAQQGPAAPSTQAPTGVPTITPVTTGAYEVASATEGITGITPQQMEASSYQPVATSAPQGAGAVGYSAQGYTAQTVPALEAQGYEARGYEAGGYEALQGVARTTAENVSEAIQRITGVDSPIMQRAVAQATAEANRRGLLNSSMAAGAAQGAILDRAYQIAQGDIQNEQFNVAQQNAMEAQNIQMGNEALRFTADARNQASAFLANAQNRASEFLAAERNQNGRFNAEQANRAAEFSANAANQAAQFSSAAQNQASIFNAGEANRMSMFTAEQANIASRFAAEMQQSASQFNATAFNQAQQRYADAMNAALAAEVDATNQSRRDMAMFQQQAQQNALDRENRIQLAGISADASASAAGAAASASMANAAAQREFSAAQSALDRQFRAEENALAREFQREAGGQRMFETYMSYVSSALRDPNLTAEGLRNYLQTISPLASGSPWSSVSISVGGTGGTSGGATSGTGGSTSGTGGGGG